MTKRKDTFQAFADRLKGDKVVWIIVLMLFLFSIVCMFSSTSRLVSDELSRLDILKEQFLVVGAGLLLIIGLYNIRSIKFFRTLSILGFPLSFILLVLLDLHIDTPFLRAIELNGAYRILYIPGIQIHVFEVVKVAMVMYLAWAQDAIKKGEIKWLRVSEQWKKNIFVYAPFLIIFFLVIPGSNSSALLIGFVMFVVILLGGGNKGDMFKLALAGVLALTLCVGIYYISGGKMMNRIGTGISRIFSNEDHEKTFLEARRGSLEYQNALDNMRQPYSAKIAVKEGGLLGKGPGQSTQRYVVPDISEDYIYSFIVEEYGLIGGIIVIFLYISLLARGSIIVRNCGNDNYAKICVAGLCILISGQAFLHMAVNADIIPMTGQTLPLISHGTSAFLCFCIAFGVILSISRIAVKRIEKETRESDPLVEMHDSVKADLDDLDAFESGNFGDGYEI